MSFHIENIRNAQILLQNNTTSSASPNMAPANTTSLSVNDISISLQTTLTLRGEAHAGVVEAAAGSSRHDDLPVAAAARRPARTAISGNRHELKRRVAKNRQLLLDHAAQKDECRKTVERNIDRIFIITDGLSTEKGCKILKNLGDYISSLSRRSQIDIRDTAEDARPVYQQAETSYYNTRSAIKSAFPRMGEAMGPLLYLRRIECACKHDTYPHQRPKTQKWEL